MNKQFEQKSKLNAIISWDDYQKAKHIVSVFEKNQKEIQSKRLSLKSMNWDSTLIERIWFKRQQLNEEMYTIRALSDKEIERIGRKFLDDWIAKQIADLVELRKRVFLK